MKPLPTWGPLYLFIGHLLVQLVWEVHSASGFPIGDKASYSVLFLRWSPLQCTFVGVTTFGICSMWAFLSRLGFASFHGPWFDWFLQPHAFARQVAVTEIILSVLFASEGAQTNLGKIRQNMERTRRHTRMANFMDWNTPKQSDIFVGHLRTWAPETSKAPCCTVFPGGRPWRFVGSGSPEWLAWRNWCECRCSRS